MPMKADEHDDAALESFFDAARATAPAPSGDLLARVLADAESVRSAAPGVTRGVTLRATTQGVTLPSGWTARIRDLLGGWPTMAGLATAAAAGLWIGAGLPDRLPGPGEASYVVDITPEMAFGLAGGRD